MHMPLVVAIALAITRRDPAMLDSAEALVMCLPRRAHDALAAAALANGFALLGDNQRGELWARRSVRTLRVHPTTDDAAVIRLLDHAPDQQMEALNALRENVRKTSAFWGDQALGSFAKAAAIAQRQDLIDALEQKLKSEHNAGNPDLDEAFTSLATLAARNGQAEKTRDLIECIGVSDGSMRDAARGQAAMELLNSGRFDDALALAQEVTDSKKRAKAFGDIARGALIAGQHVVAIESADRAIAASRSLDDPLWNAYFLSKIAVALARTGRLSEARDHTLRAKALIEQTLPGARTELHSESVALALIEIGELDLAQPFVDCHGYPALDPICSVHFRPFALMASGRL